MIISLTGGSQNQRDQWDDLLDAIVERAAQDYAVHLRHAKRTYLRDGEVPSWVMGEIWRDEGFFRSPWYHALCDLDGEYLIKRIKDFVLGEKLEERMGIK